MFSPSQPQSLFGQSTSTGMAATMRDRERETGFGLSLSHGGSGGPGSSNGTPSTTNTNNTTNNNNTNTNSKLFIPSFLAAPHSLPTSSNAAHSHSHSHSHSQSHGHASSLLSNDSKLSAATAATAAQQQQHHHHHQQQQQQQHQQQQTRSPSLFQNTLPPPQASSAMPALSLAATLNPTTPPATHAHLNLGLSASFASNMAAASSDSAAYSDDYGMDYGSPASPKSRSASFKNSGAANTPNYAADAPPTGSLFDMPQFGSSLAPSGASSSGWSPNISRNSSAVGTPVLRNVRPSNLSSLNPNPILPPPPTSSHLFPPHQPAQSQPTTTVRVVGFPPHLANPIIAHFESLSQYPVTANHQPGSNYMTLTYSDAAGYEKALGEDMKELEGGVMIVVKSVSNPATTTSNGTNHHQQDSGYRNGIEQQQNSLPRKSISSPVKPSSFDPHPQQHSPSGSHLHHLHPTSFHPYARGGSSNQPTGSPTKLHVNTASPRRGMVGGASPDRFATRRVHSHASGSVFANGRGGSGQPVQVLGNGGGGIVRPASVWSQVLNTVFGW
ncbi:hypothetical protein HDU79_006866 [Rhizoclosmatium sp. JEL0117]|nr:hypothetical protein HDU79_006866 [Rhizoclosmatium sp. JEL0117]